jgi:hypothetical protein
MAEDKVVKLLRKELSELEARTLVVREALRVLEGAGGAPNASWVASTEVSGASEAGRVHHRTGKKMSDDTRAQMKASAEARWKRDRDRKAADLAAQGEAEGSGEEAGGTQGKREDG